ncbi:MAG: hypothetical protein RSC84_02415 [Peptostreptococcaceae bacterium]
MVNNLLFILGMIALSNGNISLLDNNKSKYSDIDMNTEDGYMRSKGLNKNNKIKLKNKLRPKKTDGKDNIEEEKNIVDIEETIEDISSFSINDLDKGMKMLELSDDDLDRGLEIITRTKKYMDRDEKKVLVKMESVLDLVRGIKKLSNVDMIDDEDESDFFRSMEEADKKNMMIKEILEVFPESKKESVEKAMDMKKKIELFAELFLPDDIGEESGTGFSLSSLASINNLGSLSNLKLLGGLLRTDNKSVKNNKNCYSDIKEDIYDDFEEEYFENEEYYEIEDESDEYIDDDYVRINK